METVDWFGPGVAERYDDDDGVRFTAEHLAVESGFLADLAGEGGRALEFAIGTGRVALPLRERGVDVHGVDLSAAMVAQLRAKAGAPTCRWWSGTTPPPSSTACSTWCTWCSTRSAT